MVVGIPGLILKNAQYFLFTSVNKKSEMTVQRKDLAAFTIIIGVLTLILAASALAEKAHEAHLPERNGRGTAEIPLSLGLPVGILILMSTALSFARNTNRGRSQSAGRIPSLQSCCTARVANFTMECPMRRHPCRTQPTC
jgi:uncharacterized membrane protein YidH (DUF202 family)